jgi:type VI secretion system protein VasG
LDQLNAELDPAGREPLMRVCVDAQIVGEVVSGWTGIPIGKMLKDEIATVLKLERHLGARVIGQDHALEAISERIRTSKRGTGRSHQACGRHFCWWGPAASARPKPRWRWPTCCIGGEQNIITINMSEFQEAHTVSTLKGSPPGYVGYGEGGVLTEAVRRRPYRWCCWTKWRRPIPTCWSCSSRCSTKA